MALDRTGLRQRTPSAAAAIAVAMVTMLGARDAASQARPDVGSMVQVQGGGFIFNYRIGEAFYGVVLKPQRALPAGTVIEAAFDDPAGGQPLIVRERFDGTPKAISLRSPPVKGVKADHDYAIRIRLLDRDSGEVIAELAKTLRSNVDQSILPERPVTIGPGYHRNPESRRDPPLK